MSRRPVGSTTMPPRKGVVNRPTAPRYHKLKSDKELQPAASSLFGTHMTEAPTYSVARQPPGYSPSRSNAAGGGYGRSALGRGILPTPNVSTVYPESAASGIELTAPLNPSYLGTRGAARVPLRSPARPVPAPLAPQQRSIAVDLDAQEGLLRELRNRVRSVQSEKRQLQQQEAREAAAAQRALRAAREAKQREERLRLRNEREIAVWERRLQRETSGLEHLQRNASAHSRTIRGGQDRTASPLARDELLDRISRVEALVRSQAQQAEPLLTHQQQPLHAKPSRHVDPSASNVAAMQLRDSIRSQMEILSKCNSGIAQEPNPHSKLGAAATGSRRTDDGLNVSHRTNAKPAARAASCRRLSDAELRERQLEYWRGSQRLLDQITELVQQCQQTAS